MSWNIDYNAFYGRASDFFLKAKIDYLVNIRHIEDFFKPTIFLKNYFSLNICFKPFLLLQIKVDNLSG